MMEHRGGSILKWSLWPSLFLIHPWFRNSKDTCKPGKLFWFVLYNELSLGKIFSQFIGFESQTDSFLTRRLGSNKRGQVSQSGPPRPEWCTHPRFHVEVSDLSGVTWGRTGVVSLSQGRLWTFRLHERISNVQETNTESSTRFTICRTHQEWFGFLKGTGLTPPRTYTLPTFIDGTMAESDLRKSVSNVEPRSCP